MDPKGKLLQLVGSEDVKGSLVRTGEQFCMRMTRNDSGCQVRPCTVRTILTGVCIGLVLGGVG